MSGYEVGTKVKVVACREGYDDCTGSTGVVIEVEHKYEFDYMVQMDITTLQLPFFADELEKL